MRVLVYCPFAPTSDTFLGGAQRCICGLLTELEARDVTITVACPKETRLAVLPSSARLRVVDALLAADKHEVKPTELHSDISLLAELSRDVDVVLTIDRHFPAMSARPVVLCLNNFSYGPMSRSAFGLNWDAIVVPSDYVRRCLLWHFGEHSWLGLPRPVHVVPYGLSLQSSRESIVEALRSELGLPRTSRLLAFPHRPSPGKGFETALRAVLRLRRQGADYRLLVPTPEARSLSWQHQRHHIEERFRLVDQTGISDAVRFHRWIGSSELPSYLRLAEWSVCPSEEAESFGLSVVEGVAAGLPVAATPAGAVPDVIPPGHGVSYVDFRDDEALAKQIGAERHLEAIERGRKYLESEFTWDRCGASWCNILSSVQKSAARWICERPDPVGKKPWIRTLPSGRVWDDYLEEYVS